MFRRFEMVLSGHFHKKSDDGQIYFLGSQYEFNWNDYNCQKGFHVFDTETENNRKKYEIQIQYTKRYIIMMKKIITKTLTYEKYKHKYVKLIVEKKKDYFSLINF